MNARAVWIPFLCLLLCAAPGFSQTGEESSFTDFNWHTVLGLEPAAAMVRLWEHAQRFNAETYDRKAILKTALDLYAAGRELERAFPYDTGRESRSKYKLSYDRGWSTMLDLPWGELLKLNVRSAMQYLLLEILYTKGIPKSKSTLPAHWALYQEYFAYYRILKTASR